MSYLAFKRGADCVLAILALVLLSPVFLLVMLILKLTGDGEVFYRQPRVGYRNHPFRMWKFATMVRDSPNIGTRDMCIEGDPRVLPVGRWLRKTKINELPQLFNILTGEMSFVGPRPLMPVSYQALEPAIRDRLYMIRPGLTGIASIFFRDESEIIARSPLGPRAAYDKVVLPHKGRLELWYQEHATFWLDLKIVLLTAWVVAFPGSGLVYKVFRTLPRCRV